MLQVTDRLPVVLHKRIGPWDWSMDLFVAGKGPRAWWVLATVRLGRARLEVQAKPGRVIGLLLSWGPTLRVGLGPVALEVMGWRTEPPPSTPGPMIWDKFLDVPIDPRLGGRGRVLLPSGSEETGEHTAP